MKTNTLKIILSAIVSSGVTALAMTSVAANYFDLMAMGVGYVAVAILVALAVVDYRGNTRKSAAR
jgi:hypothetical protein